MMNEYKQPRMIAEIGCNHKGEMEIAHEMIKMAAIYCKAGGEVPEKMQPGTSDPGTVQCAPSQSGKCLWKNLWRAQRISGI